MKRQNIDKGVRLGFLIITFFSITALFLIMIFLLKEGLPVFKDISISDFIFGHYWYPTDDPADFGIFPLLLGTVCVTLLSGIMAIPLGIMTAVYLAEIAPLRTAEIIKPIVELMASMPSVIIGFFGMVVVAPFIQKLFNIPVGLNMFNASLMLAVILGLSRAVGETMVVLMAAGGAAMIPKSIFDPVRPMPACIAAEMAEAPFGSEHYHALFAIGIVLFIFTFIFNLIADYISYKFRQVGEASL
ncbi:MAG: phosphate ABC transporter permease subunit PstC [Desulfobacteraceae bacterium 4572_19]|nr:MAG: phosphate ABC transporter permease subunit PstC [Desulfobacteraceae bacterium 4572_19]